MGYARTALLLAAMTGLFLAVGYVIGGHQGMAIALGVSILIHFFTYWNADKLVLSMYRAKPIDKEQASDLHDLVANLAARADLPMPKLYLIENPQPNAFATGRNPDHAAIAVTAGLLRLLDKAELAGVLSHELAHIKNRDSLLMNMTAILAGAIGMLANFGFLFGRSRTRGNGGPAGGILALAAIILAPLAAMLVQLAISRGREYEADRVGASISGKPHDLANALAKISATAREIPNLPAEEHPASAHLFIVNPLQGVRADNLFSTHPSPENRIQRLLAMESPPSIAGMGTKRRSIIPEAGSGA